MYSSFQLGLKYLKYYVTASNGHGHGMHAPFVFDFITTVLNDDRHFYAYQSIENLRQLLCINRSQITIEEYGAGSRVKKNNVRAIDEIAASSLKPKKYGQLLFRIIDRYAPQTILELGSSLGITTAYLASANTTARVITLEGATAIAAIAKQNFTKLGLTNIELIEGNFDETLAPVLASIPSLDFVFIDGNHRLEPTLRYFRQLLPVVHPYSILVFDDIHWSHEMEQAWSIIQDDPAVTISIDLFAVGLIFFRTENKAKQHFTIRC